MGDQFIPRIPEEVLALPPGVQGKMPVGIYNLVWERGSFPARFCGLLYADSREMCCLARGHSGPHLWWNRPHVMWWPARESPLMLVKQLEP